MLHSTCEPSTVACSFASTTLPGSVIPIFGPGRDLSSQGLAAGSCILIVRTPSSPSAVVRDRDVPEERRLADGREVVHAQAWPRHFRSVPSVSDVIVMPGAFSSSRSEVSVEPGGAM